MKQIIRLGTVLMFFVIFCNVASADTNKTAQFGYVFLNISYYTVFVGGISGIVNASGNITTSDHFIGNGTFLNVNRSDFWDNYDSPTAMSVNYSGFCGISNYSSYANHSSYGNYSSFSNYSGYSNFTFWWRNFSSISDLVGINNSQINNLSWIKLFDYPVECPSGTYLTAVNDSSTCVAAMRTTGDSVTGNYKFGGGVNVTGVANFSGNISVGGGLIYWNGSALIIEG